MRIADLLDVDRVALALDASDKGSALLALSRLFPGRDPDEVHRVLVERERLASTGVGSGVAIPHGRLDALDRLEAALALHPSGVPFDAVDGAPATIFVVLLAPPHHAGEHLKALARFSRLLRDDGVRARLLAAATEQEALDVLLGADAGTSVRPPRA